MNCIIPFNISHVLLSVILTPIGTVLESSDWQCETKYSVLQ